MVPISLQFYSFFMVVLCGSALGVLSDLLRIVRRRYDPPTWLGWVADLLFWVVATATMAGGLFLGNWGEVRLYVIVGALAGIGMYYWLASPVVWGVANFILAVIEWMLATLVKLVLLLVWRPIVALGLLLWRFLLWLWGLVIHIGQLLLGLLEFLLWRPVRGPYRFCKLHYLLTKRRVKRWLRHKLLGPPDRRS